MPGRLNSFQKTMLQWNDLHPYNAIHVVRIPATLDGERLGHFLTGALEQRGLTGLELDRDRGTFEYRGGAMPPEIRIVPAEHDPRRALSVEIERQLNRAFVRKEPFVPFRFFAVPEADAFFLGLVYFHAASDAESIVFLLRDLVAGYALANAAAPVAALDLYPRRPDNLLRRPAVLARKLAALPAFINDLRNSCRPPGRGAGDFQNRFVFFSLAPQTLRSLINAGKSWNVTVNDLFLALLMKSLSPLATARARGHRRKLSLGCIVNTRKDLGLDSPRAFGLFLGSFIVTRDIPAATPLRELAGHIHQHTLRVKRGKLYLGAPLEMAFGRWMMSLFSTDRRKKLYQKHYPLWGGITNMNLNSIWDQRNEPAPVDYFRAVATGPVTPLVLSATTVGEKVNLGLTYRSAVFAEPEIERVKDDFLGFAGQLEVRA